MRSLDQLNALRDLRADLEATRSRALDLRLPPADRRLAQQRLVAVTAEIERLEAPPAPPPPPAALLDPKLSPADAAKRAAAIRAHPGFWDPFKRKPDGTPAITAEERTRLIQELREADARAAESEPPTDAA